MKAGRKNKTLMRLVFRYWAIEFAAYVKKDRILEAKKKKFIKKRLLGKWKDELK